MQNEKEIVLEELNNMVVRIQNNLESTGTNASGRTSKSFRIENNGFSFTVLARPYFRGVEIGRPDGGVPKGFNAIIKEWCINKKLTIKQIPYKRQQSENWRPKYSVQERSLNIAAGAIANKIKLKGTKLHIEGGRDDIYSKEIKNTVEIITEKLKQNVVSQVIQQIKLNTKK